MIWIIVSFEQEPVWIIVEAIAALYLFYIINKMITRLRTNAPALVLSENSLEMNGMRKKEGVFVLKWSEIQSFSVAAGENAYYLIVSTESGKKKMQLNWLDKNPKEIEELLNKYRENNGRFRPQ